MKVYARARSGERGCKIALPEAEVEVPVPEHPARMKPWSSNISNACSNEVCFKKNRDEYRSCPPLSGSLDSLSVSPNTSLHRFTYKNNIDKIYFDELFDFAKKREIRRSYIFLRRIFIDHY